jgi:hypothetical protein
MGTKSQENPTSSHTRGDTHRGVWAAIFITIAGGVLGLAFEQEVTEAVGIDGTLGWLVSFLLGSATGAGVSYLSLAALSHSFKR